MKRLFVIITALAVCACAAGCASGRMTAYNEDGGETVVYRAEADPNDENMMRFLATGHSVEAYNMVKDIIGTDWEVATQKTAYANEVVDPETGEAELGRVGLEQFKALEHDDIDDIPANFTERIMRGAGKIEVDLIDRTEY